jgi:hypothetical protein
MALVLLRKKIVQLVDSKNDPDGSSEMIVHAARNKREYVVPVCESLPERLLELQDELCEQLFTDRPLDPTELESEESLEAG